MGYNDRDIQNFVRKLRDIKEDKISKEEVLLNAKKLVNLFNNKLIRVSEKAESRRKVKKAKEVFSKILNEYKDNGKLSNVFDSEKLMKFHIVELRCIIDVVAEESYILSDNLRDELYDLEEEMYNFYRNNFLSI